MAGMNPQPAAWCARQPSHHRMRVQPYLPARLRRGIAAVALMLALSPCTALADLSFTSQRDTLVITSVGGSGSPDDPVVLAATVVADGEIVIAIGGMSDGLGNRARSNHFTSFELVLALTNATDRPWTSFALALEEQPGLGSDYLDGLSFGQDALGSPTRATSDRFARAQVTNEPRDGIRFSIGVVGPGETVLLRFLVTDNTPTEPVYLVHYRDQPVAGLPRALPATPPARGVRSARGAA